MVERMSMCHVPVGELHPAVAYRVEAAGLKAMPEALLHHLRHLDRVVAERSKGVKYQIEAGGKVVVAGRTYVLQGSYWLSGAADAFGVVPSTLSPRGKFRNIIAAELEGHHVELRIPMLYHKIQQLVNYEHYVMSSFHNFSEILVSDGLHLRAGPALQRTCVEQRPYNFMAELNEVPYGHAAWRRATYWLLPLITEKWQGKGTLFEVAEDVIVGVCRNSSLADIGELWEYHSGSPLYGENNSSQLRKFLDTRAHELVGPLVGRLASDYTTHWIEEDYFNYYYRAAELI